MSTARVSLALRRLVAAAANHRCGYCLTSELITGTPLEIEHLLPESRGGRTIEENLWLACRPCNLHKSDRVAAVDPETGEAADLFNPRRDCWTDHFAWSPNGLRIEGRTAVGRAAVLALHLNRPTLLVARQTWVRFGLHPPT
jgi:hypothetical protein